MRNNKVNEIIVANIYNKKVGKGHNYGTIKPCKQGEIYYATNNSN